MSRRPRVNRARRSFLFGRFVHEAEHAVGGALLGPPPPALAGRHAGDNPCLRCEAPCVAACEPNIIRRHPPQHRAAGRAWLDFTEAGCTFCGECVDVCPAVSPERPARLALGLARITWSECVALGGVVCMNCRVICPEGAITHDLRGRPELHPEICNGCGRCVSVCPPRAIRIQI